MDSQGAEYAWYQTIVEYELMQFPGIPYCGGAADIAKLFDQRMRPLVYQLATPAGMDQQLLNACKAYHEHVWIYNTLTSTTGEAFKKRCPIPQGCLLSMMFVNHRARY